jgi:phospholipase/carboxylesterase
MPVDLLKCVEIEPDGPAEFSVIWLHGLGANGHDFEPIVPSLGIDETLQIRFVFPHAPHIPVSINNGMEMPAWYDIINLDLGGEIDATQLRNSAYEISRLISRENERGITAENIIIAGFSQGGAVGYEIALSYPEKLAGLIALSTYFATEKTIKLSSANNKLPVFIGHGRHDQMVLPKKGKEAYNFLKNKQYPVEHHEYEVAHGVDMDEVREIGSWINRVFNVEK